MNKQEWFDDPLVSVIIPVYNCENYLAEAIESVLVQTYRPIEVIAVDDGSTDSSADVAKLFGPLVRYHFQSNSGTGAARNKGVELAQGDFLAFLDQDDLWVRQKLKRQMTALKCNTKLDMVFGYVKQFYSSDLPEDTRKQVTIPCEMTPGNHVGTMLIKRDAFLRVGLFGRHLQIAEFVDWYARAKELGLCSLMLPEIIMKRRVHETNQSFLKREHRVEYVRVLKASLDRRRSRCPCGTQGE